MSAPRPFQTIDALVDHLIETMDADDDVITEPRHGWQDFLQRLAHGVRRVALAHPEAFPLVASRPPEAPWLRPPPQEPGLGRVLRLRTAQGIKKHID